MRIVVKVGSQQLLTDKGEVNQQTIDLVVDQLVELRRRGHQPVLVSSGAIACGKVLADRRGLTLKKGDSSTRQLLAAIGQARLINRYAHSLERYTMLPAQVLLTHQDFLTRKHYLNVQGLFTQLLSQDRTLAIINENDSVAIEELMFTDNDQLAGMVASLLGAEKLVLLTNVDGVFSSLSEGRGGELIRELTPDSRPQIGRFSAAGRGGMASKLSSARRAAHLGITVHIAHVNHPEVLSLIVDEPHPPGTVVRARQPFRSPFKRWLASGLTGSVGRICVTAQLRDLLREGQKARSILPVGILSYQGTFQRGDVVDVFGPGGEKVGMGLARYGHAKLGQICGQQGQAAFIHYNYLYIQSADS